jgi:hypothetical protein
MIRIVCSITEVMIVCVDHILFQSPGFIFYHCIYGCMFGMFLFCKLCIHIVTLCIFIIMLCDLLLA